MERCKKCEEWIYDGGVNLYGRPHDCGPMFLGLDADESDDWDDASEIYAYDAEQAAEKFAESIDDGYGEGASERKVRIKKPSTGEVKTFDITFDYSVDYSASEVEDA